MMTLTEFIYKVEGFSPKAYDIEGDIAGVDTIGVGHLLTDEERSTGMLYIAGEYVPWREGITRKQAMELLAQDLFDFEKCVKRLVAVPLTDNQRVALISFCYNVGCGAFKRSTLLRLLNTGAYDQVPGQLRRWVKNNGFVVPGLKNRREREIAMWEGRL